MANSDMPRVDMKKEFAKLNESDQHFVRKLEEMNQKRGKDIRALKSRNRLTAALIGVGVFGIYFYTISAVKQEKFLDFEEVPAPKTVSASASSST